MERVADHHLTVLSSVPAGPKWSFGGRGRSTSAAPSPGPGAYEPTLRASSPSVPSYGFGNEPRGRNMILGYPGPGAYNPALKQNMRNAPQWTMPGRKASKQMDHSPGPGAYDSKLPSSSPSYGVGTGGRKIISAPNTPGPGTYNPPYVGHSSPQWGMGTGIRSGALGQAKDSFMPGPGAYTLPSKLQTGPQYSMGARGEFKPREGTPGPGAYQARLPEKDAGKYSFGMKTSAATFGGNSPGPAAYNPAITAARSHSPQWTFGSQDRSSKTASGTPGPGQYNPTQSARKQPPAWSFGGGGERSFYSKSDSPAPGTYTLSSRLGEGAKYSIGTQRRIDWNVQRQDIPGPCTYDPKISDAAPKWGFGSSQRQPLSLTLATPGPGNIPAAKYARVTVCREISADDLNAGSYNVKESSSAPQWTLNPRRGDVTAGGNANKDGGKLGSIYTTFGY